MAGKICAKATDYLNDLGSLCKRVDAEAVERLADWIYHAWREDNQVFTFGNGGSASTASHYVADLVKTAAVDGQRRLRAFCLVDNIGMTTALGNDIDYDQTFVYPLATYARSGDLAIAISASGNSPNIVNACRWSKDHGVRLAALTGFEGGKIADLADVHINVPSENYGLIEDLHLSVNHIVSQMLKVRITSGANNS